MNTGTPTSGKTDRKRFLSSPMDLTDSKKNKSDIRTLSIEEDPAEMSQSVTSSSLSQSDLLQISNLLGETFQDKMTDLINSIVNGVLSGLKTQINELQTENSSLKNRVSCLETKLDKAEQYSRRNCLRISGLPEIADENTDDKVLSLAKDMGVDLAISEIDRTHRIGRRIPETSSGNRRPRDIIVKFATFRSRLKMYKQKSKLKEASYKGVFLNEDLTRERSQMFYEARKLVKSKQATSAWTTDGVIIVKDNAMRIYRVETPDELAQLKCKIGVS